MNAAPLPLARRADPCAGWMQAADLLLTLAVPEDARPIHRASDDDVREGQTLQAPRSGPPRGCCEDAIVDVLSEWIPAQHGDRGPAGGSGGDADALRAHVTQNLTWEKSAQQLLRAYEKHRVTR